MKNNKFLLFLACFNLVSVIFKIMVSVVDGYMIPQGWMTGLILDFGVYGIILSIPKVLNAIPSVIFSYLFPMLFSVSLHIGNTFFFSLSHITTPS